MLPAMRCVCLIMVAVFIQFTYWQFNDLTQYNTELWYCWVIAYALCCAISLVSFWKALPRKLYLAISVVGLVAGLIRFNSIEWDHKILYNPDNPAGNETGGLLIIAIWFGLLAWRHASLGCPCKKK